jgi:hypothetical protein
VHLRTPSSVSRPTHLHPLPLAPPRRSALDVAGQHARHTGTLGRHHSTIGPKCLPSVRILPCQLYKYLPCQHQWQMLAVCEEPIPAPWAMALTPLGPAQIQSHFSRVPSTIFSLCADSHYVGHTADRPGWAKHCTMNASVYCCSTYCTVTYSTVPSTYRILHLESIVVWKVSDTPQGA